MSKPQEIEFLNHLGSFKKVYDSKKCHSFIQDKSTYSDAVFYRGIGYTDTNTYLNGIFLKKYGDLMTDPFLKKINNHLNYDAKTDGVKANINFRVEKIEDNIYINLGTGKTVRVNALEVKILNNSKAKFEINDNIGEMVLPDLKNGDIKLLSKYIMVSDDELKLILVFIFNCFFTDTHYVMLLLIGPGGSAKSFIKTVIKTIVDPCPVMLRNQIDSSEVLAIAAISCHLIALNNVSKLSNAIQDNLCTTLTGGARTSRKNYTNKGQSAIHTHNPVICNGTGVIITREDALQRSVTIPLKRISETDVMPISEKQLTEEFMNDLPRIMGGIFNALSDILYEYETFEVPKQLHRMADFHILGCVTEKALEWKPDSFTKAYNENILTSQMVILETSDVAQAIIKMKQYGNDFIGTFLELKDRLIAYGKNEIGKIEPRELSAEIDCISALLLKFHDIKVTKLKRSNSGNRLKIKFN